MKKPKPTQERVRELLHYDRETGVFTRKTKPRFDPPDRKYGRVGAGRIGELGNVLVMVDGINYSGGPLAWLYEHGEWPRRIKYIDGNQQNCRIENIRVHTKSAEEIKDEKLTLERLKELLHYEPETGYFTWRVASSNADVGERAGSTHGFGYRSIGVDYKKYLEHSLAYFYMTGEWQTGEIDHINRDKADNRWSNLRHSNRSENSHNKAMNKRNRLKFPGVMVHGNKYRARIDVRGVAYDLGCFNTLAEARVARLLAEKKHFGKFMTYDDKRDGVLPLGDGFVSTFVRDNRLFLMGPEGGPEEITDISQFSVVPVTEDGHAIN